MNNRTFPPAVPSLTGRLIAGYLLAMLLTLSIAGVYLHESLWQNFETEDAELLTDHINALREEVLKHPSDFERIGQLIASTAGTRKLERYYGQLRDPAGRVVAETPDYHDLAPPAEAYPEPVGPKEPLTELTLTRSASGNRTFLASALVADGLHGSNYTYHIVFDAAHIEGWMRDYRHRLILMILVGTLLSGGLGWSITRNALRPLREITATVQKVTVHDLNEQICARSWPQELTALAEAFDKMLARLEASFLRLNQFSADVAHEVRTPLNNLMGSTSLVLSANRPVEEYRNALVANLEEYERMKRLVESLLFLARADNREAVVRKEPVDLAKISSEVLDFFSALAEEKRISFTLVGDACVMADEPLLRMAITNLVSNALRHTPEGGKVGIEIQSMGEVFKVMVSDTGEGIAQDHLERVFDRFFRADESRTNEKHPRTGLGLALVRSAMELHGGSASVESIPGQGARFTLILPA
ncbi:MAG TPA: heavy metal sensor histidine kinase [Chthoniobacteraceae bacterium]|nr:heavy metal sensor histidine kinase [Chthoniobacteraceae bacterium]